MDAQCPSHLGARRDAHGPGVRRVGCKRLVEVAHLVGCLKAHVAIAAAATAAASRPAVKRARARERHRLRERVARPRAGVSGVRGGRERRARGA
eukprot:7378030-Prymnesium_polylepis.1